MAKKRFFTRDYWLKLVIATEPSKRYEVLIDMVSSFLNDFQDKEHHGLCLKQYGNQAKHISSAKLDIDDGYTLFDDWFQSALYQMVILSEKHSENKENRNIKDLLKIVFNTMKWDYDKASVQSKDYFISYRAVSFLACVDKDGVEIFDDLQLPMYHLCEFAHGTKWEMKNGKVWTSHGLCDEGEKVILYHENVERYEEKKFSKERVRKMKRVDKWIHL